MQRCLTLLPHVPGTSGNAKMFDPSAYPANLPIFQEVPYFEDTHDNPVYAIYMGPQSTIYLGLLDWHIGNLKSNFQGPHLGFNFPHIEIIFDMVEERKRHLLLKDVLGQAQRRLDLCYVFKEHRNHQTWFLHRLKLIKAIFNTLPPEHDHITYGMLAQYEQFCSYLPEYIATFQEAMTYAT